MSISNPSETGARHISFSARERAEDSVELAIRAFGEDFCASGAAFFSIAELKIFVSALRGFPLIEEPFISGGYFDDAGDNISNENFYISVAKLNTTGLLVMKVRAFTPHPEYWKKGLGSGGQCSYFLYYEDLKKFADEFERLIEGESSYLILATS
ncbi:hypothetical protein [Methylosinus sp. LW4]|uniref:hypothetical protein n=1 Tax=Methylosinus sp. LW4 TaxID=136993 RepID=UPI0012FA9158|nr:hypothetical protein [Methylosinus sp. LW4]